VRPSVCHKSLALIVLLAASAPGTARATVSSITYGKTYAASNEVAVFRRKNNELVIRGSLLDLLPRSRCVAMAIDERSK
jgi:hypothetical protein